MTNYNDGKWHGWNGGECPVHPETVVDVLFDDESGIKNSPARIIFWDTAAPAAFRVVKEHKEPREFWVVPKSVGMSPEVWTEDPKGKNWYGEEIIHVREVME